MWAVCPVSILSRMTALTDQPTPLQTVRQLSDKSPQVVTKHYLYTQQLWRVAVVITDDTHIGAFIHDHTAGPHGDDGRVEDLHDVLVTAVTTGQAGHSGVVVPGSTQVFLI